MINDPHYAEMDELEERVSEIAGMMQEIGGMASRCRAMGIDAADELLSARDALNLELEASREDLEELYKWQMAGEEADYRDMVLPI